MRVAFYTLGCKVNFYESEVLGQAFLERGHQIVPFGDACDGVIVHSCAVTEESARKSRQILRRARRLCSEGAVAVLGCLSQVSDRDFPEADLILGTGEKMSLPQRMEDCLKSKKRFRKVLPAHTLTVFEPMILRSGTHTRAFVKIQDGCNNFCSYCIIPYARGPIRSKEIGQAVAEIQGLVEIGYSEIVLTGIHLDSYGREHGRFDLCDLLERIDGIAGLRRVRLGSLEPVFVTKERVERLRRLRCLCPHFHLSLQSGCTQTLRRMNRRYTGPEYEACGALIRNAFPNAALTTDMIVGFPGETEKEFEDSFALAQRMNFAKIHVFPFSARQGTRACAFPDPVPPEVRRARVRRLLALSAKSEANYLSSFRNTAAEVLFETEKNGLWTGFTEYYVPVWVRSETDLTGRFGTVLLSGQNPNGMTGTLLSVESSKERTFVL